MPSSNPVSNNFTSNSNSNVISNSNSTIATTTSRSRTHKRKKSPRRQPQKRNGNTTTTTTTTTTTNNNESKTETHERWKSEKLQQRYSSKLLHSLNKAPLSPSSPRRSCKAVREAADRTLAFSARGRSRWSRAMLASRIKIKFRKNRRKRQTSAGAGAGVAAGAVRGRKRRVSVLRLRGKILPAVQRKVRLLGRLVPGCRKQPLPVILEEAADYVAALEMQVRAMTALADFLSRSATVPGENAASSSSPTTIR